MKAFRFILLFTTAICLFSCTSVKEYPDGVYDDGLLKDIRPEGWIKEALERQVSGLSGHPEALSYPFNSCLWAGEFLQGKHGEDWWRYEQTAYYTDGILKLGYLLGDEQMTARAEEGVKYTLDHQTEDGLLGVDGSRSKTRQERLMWPQAVFFRPMKAYYEMTGDERVPKALEKYYLHYDSDIIGLGRNIVNVEGMVWTWKRTGNKALLDLACKAFLEGKYEIRPELLESGEPLHIHGVTFCEELKLPIILYEATGDTTFLNIARKAEANLIGYNMLPDGVPTSAEYVEGKDMMVGHEACDIADFTWTEGYYLMATGDGRYSDAIERAVFNAGFGTITKDFKALQYFSCLNQFIVTGRSDHNKHAYGSTWMAYRSSHQTECCAGNINRIMPNYVSRMWMSCKDGGIAATLYGPSSVTYKGLEIKESTTYPFDETVCFNFGGRSVRMPFTVRIPVWARGYKLFLNGKQLECNAAAGTFAMIDRRWKAGDELKLVFEAVPEAIDAAGQGTCIQRGALLYAYPIPQRMVEDTTVYAHMFGKHSENPDFKDWNIYPDGAFNYALSGSSIEEVNLEGASGYPYDNPPMGLRVPVRKIDWELREDRFTPAIPESPVEALSDSVEYITLVPYGATELRLTVFPVTSTQNIMEKFDFNSIPEEQYPNFKGGEKALSAKMFFDGMNRILKGKLVPGASIGTHTHSDSSEIIFITAGKGYAVLDGETVRLVAGDVHYCPKGHTHCLVNDGTEDLEFSAVVPVQ